MILQNLVIVIEGILKRDTIYNEKTGQLYSLAISVVALAISVVSLVSNIKFNENYGELYLHIAVIAIIGALLMGVFVIKQIKYLFKTRERFFYEMLYSVIKDTNETTKHSD